MQTICKMEHRKVAETQSWRRLSSDAPVTVNIFALNLFVPHCSALYAGSFQVQILQSIYKWIACKSLFPYVRWLNLARIFQQKLFDGKILSQPPDFLKKNIFQNGFQEIFSGQGWRGKKKKKKKRNLFSSSPQHFLSLLKITSDLQAKLGRMEAHAEHRKRISSLPHSRCCLACD